MECFVGCLDRDDHIFIQALYSIAVNDEGYVSRLFRQCSGESRCIDLVQGRELFVGYGGDRLDFSSKWRHN